MRLTGLLNRWILFAVAVLALAAGLDNEYYFTLLNFIGIHTLLVVGLNLLLGYAGQISLGHAAFFGLGAYASGILTATYGVNPWLALLAGLAISGTAAFLIGIPALKLKGYYLAMATLGFGIIVYIVLNEASHLTGGPSGLSGIPSLSVAGFPLNTARRLYLLVWLAVGVILALSANLVDSRTGRALRALHDSEGRGRVPRGGHRPDEAQDLHLERPVRLPGRQPLRPQPQFHRALLLRLHVLHQAGDHGGVGGHGQHLGLAPGGRGADGAAGGAHRVPRLRGHHLRGHPHGGDDLPAPGPGAGPDGSAGIPAV